MDKKERIIWFGYNPDSMRDSKLVEEYFKHQFMIICGEVIMKKDVK